MKKSLGVFIGIGVLALGIAGYSYYKYNELDVKDLPKLSVTIDGQESAQESIDWKIPFIIDSWAKPLSIAYDTIATPITTETGDVKIDINEPDAEILINIKNDKDEIIYTSDIETFNSEYVFSENGTYYIDTEMNLQTEDNGSGKATFTQKVVMDKPEPPVEPIETPEPPEPPVEKPVAPKTEPVPIDDIQVINLPEYTLSQDTLQQGDLAVITIKNVPDGIVPTAKSDLGYIRFAKTKTNGEYKSAVPTSYTTNLGEYNIDIALGNETKQFTVTVTEESFEVQQLTISESIADDTVNSDAANIEFSQKAVPFYDTANDEIYWEGAFTQPVVSRISTPYGVIRYINDDPVPVRHGGIDIAADLGTPILAPNHGVVELAEFLQLTGYTIIVEHGGGLKSYFYHMDSVSVKAGDKIEPGQEIGKVGTTGFSTGPHLHYEVKIGRRSLDPFPLFKGESSLFS